MAPKDKDGKKEKKVLFVNGELPSQIMFKLRKIYERNCTLERSMPAPSVIKALQEAKENEELVKLIMVQRVHASKPEDQTISVDPLVQAIQQCRYLFVQKLYVWGIAVSYQHIANISTWVEKSVYPLKRLELLNCFIDAESVQRLARGIQQNFTLREICLDYNEFGDAGCLGLCDELMENKLLLSLSLRYCELKRHSGSYLGQLLATTALQEMRLEGNELGCGGAIDLMKYCAAQSYKEGKERLAERHRKEEEERKLAEEAERAKHESPYGLRKTPPANKEVEVKKKKKGKKKNQPPEFPRVGPWIKRLNLSDNSIDNILDKMAALNCVKQIGLVLRFSDYIEEVNLDGNAIGDLAGRELVDALTERQAEKLAPVKVVTTYKMECATYEALLALGAGPKKKGKGKGKKKKK